MIRKSDITVFVLINLLEKGLFLVLIINNCGLEMTLFLKVKFHYTLYFTFI